MSRKPGDTRAITCPLCYVSLSKMSEAVRERHVNNCLTRPRGLDTSAAAAAQLSQSKSRALPARRGGEHDVI